MGKKIATCSYCGTRAVLVFDEMRHELTCSACGAPLHDMKFMPQATEIKPKKPSMAKMGKAATVAGAGKGAWAFRDKKSKKKRKKKPMFRRVLEDIFDEIEDIFD
ncbi:MAG: TFIIB-type zinc ribbon-containing protein [Pseudomonadota bacterium]